MSNSNIITVGSNTEVVKVVSESTTEIKKIVVGTPVKRVDGSFATTTGANVIVFDEFVGDNSTTEFELSVAPVNEEYVFISIDGVIQSTDTYTIIGSTVFFSEAPEVSSGVEIRTIQLQHSITQARDYKPYVYQPTTATSIYSGPDIYGNVLTYDVSKVEVHVNGVRLVAGIDFTASNGSTITLTGTQPTSGDTVVVTSLATTVFNNRKTSRLLSSADANQTIDTFRVDTYRSVKYILLMTRGSSHCVKEVMILHDDTNVYLTTFGEVNTAGNLGTIDASIVGDVVVLTLSPSGLNTTIKLSREELGV